MRVQEWLRDLLEADAERLQKTVDWDAAGDDLQERWAIIRGHKSILDRHSGCGCGTGRCDDGGNGWEDEFRRGAPGCAEIQALADMYSQRPGHNPAWNF